ncbi:DNA glycosylase [Hypoxylon sp. FL1284]|nr:DNA glycosylase [Hypoxylon sp. FL1284]
MATRRSARLSAAAAAAVPSIPAADPPPPAAAPAPRGRKRKAATAETQTKHGKSNGSLKEGGKETEGEGEGVKEEAAPTPATPPRKRRARKSAGDPPAPATPAPSNAPATGEPADAGPTETPKPKGVQKLADHNATLATVLSPASSRVVTQTKAGSLLEDACRHLISVDARMRPLIERHHCRVFSPAGLGERVDPYETLCSGIISQQVSGAAARAIKERFVALFADPNSPSDDENGKPRFPLPAQVRACAVDRLRSAGLSQRKAEYVQGLAAKFASGELTARLLADAPYDEVIEKLTAVRGLGRWSAEMFACFGLKRIDVFSLGDLGVQRGMAAFVGRDVAKLKKKGAGGKWKYMSEAEMRDISDRFAPYRSVFMWYMWKVEDTDVSTME